MLNSQTRVGIIPLNALFLFFFLDCSLKKKKKCPFSMFPPCGGIPIQMEQCHSGRGSNFMLGIFLAELSRLLPNSIRAGIPQCIFLFVLMSL